MSEFTHGLLSLVVPCYNEEESLPILADALGGVVTGMRERWPGLSVELVLVDDGSSDGTAAAMRLLASRRGLPYRVRYLLLSRNFGKEGALLAGLSAARGEWVCTMDADMQDPPSLLPQMYADLLTGEWDSVATRRATREGEPPVRSAFARLFYRLINRLSDAEVVDGARDFRAMSRPFVDAVLSMPERNRFTKGIYSWVGFRTKWVPYENVERAAGQTKWSFWGLARYALDGIVAFSTAPLALASVLGLVFCLLALVMVVVVVVRAALFGDPVSGWPSLMTVILLIGGAQLLCLGVIGQYLARTYVEAKQRPSYIVREEGEGPVAGPAAGAEGAGAKKDLDS